MELLFQIKLPAILDNLSGLAGPVLGCARKQGLDDGKIMKIDLSLEEILVNIVNYSYAESDAGGEVEVQFGLEAAEAGQIFVIEIIGRMDASTAPDFEKECNQWIEDGEKQMVVDFSGVEYISSAGLRGILSIGKKLKNQDGSLSLCRMGGMVQEVFEISGFSSIFPIFDTIEDALAEL